MSLDPYAPPASSLVHEKQHIYEHFYVVSLNKFVLLLMVTAGWYWLYWNYRQWQAWRQISGQPVITWLRAFFDIFFLWSLFDKIDKSLKNRGLQHDWYPGTLAIALIGITVLSAASILIPPLPGLVIAVLLNLLGAGLSLPVQRAVNRVAGDPQGLGNSHYTWANGTWLSIGAICWAFNIAFALEWIDPSA